MAALDALPFGDACPPSRLVSADQLYEEEDRRIYGGLLRGDVFADGAGVLSYSRSTDQFLSIAHPLFSYICHAIRIS